jgi:hypothetical protein
VRTAELWEKAHVDAERITATQMNIRFISFLRFDSLGDQMKMTLPEKEAGSRTGSI